MRKKVFIFLIIFINLSLYASQDLDYFLESSNNDIDEFSFLIEENSDAKFDVLSDEEYQRLSKQLTIDEWQKLEKKELRGIIYFSFDLNKLELPVLKIGNTTINLLLPASVINALKINSGDEIVVFGGSHIDAKSKKSSRNYIFVQQISYDGKTVVIDRQDFVGKELSKNRFIE